jgi:hypothetical protein
MNHHNTTSHSLFCTTSLTGSGDDMESYVTLYNPTYGAIMSDRMEIEMGSVSAERFDAIHFKASGVADTHLSADTTVIESTNMDVQPSSVFYTLRTVQSSTASINERTEEGGVRMTTPLTRYGHSSASYLEFVLSDDAIKRSRKLYHSGSGKTGAGLANRANYNPLEQRRAHTTPVQVCIFAGPKLDGQKQIWTQQSQSLAPQGFHFTWLLHLQPNLSVAEQAGSNPVLQHLTKLLPHITIAANPVFQLDLSMLAQDPGDGRGPASLVWQRVVADLYFYAYEGLVKANYVIDAVQPEWCRELFAQMRDTLLQNQCEVAVYGNQGGFGSDVALVHTAAALGIPTVAELMNLNLHPLVLPSAVVAPSRFVIEHSSVADVLQSPGSRTQGLVIPPSIDTKHFDPARYRLQGDGARTAEVYHHPSCAQPDAALAPCIVVGFVARLSPGNAATLYI